MRRSSACRECLRRGWLLSALGARLDYRSRDETRLLELLELEDGALIEAIAGRRRGELRKRWERFALEEPSGRDESGEHEIESLDAGAGTESVCRHGDGYPRMLPGCKGAPRMLHVVGGRERLKALTSRAAVAIVGSQRPTDHGMELARDLARGLAASGVTVVSGFANGIAAAAHAGAIEAHGPHGPTLTVMAGGVDVVAPAGRRGLYERVIASGCAVAELPCGYRPRRWCEPARARTIAGLAELTIVVEAEESERDLLTARVARRLGRTVAAIPGRVTSPVSGGTNVLLMEGAPLVRGPEDALDLIYGASAQAPSVPERGVSEEHGLISGERALLQATLERVGAGKDTVAKLTANGEDAGETMLALSELELMGLLGRGDGGRYVPRRALVHAPSAFTQARAADRRSMAQRAAGGPMR